MPRWLEHFGEEPVSARELQALATELGLFELGGATPGERGTRARFSRSLSRRRDRRYGPWRLKVSRDAHRKVNLYHLEAAEGAAACPAMSGHVSGQGQTSSDIFEAAVRRWVRAWGLAQGPGADADADAFLSRIEKRLQPDIATWIGAGYHLGLLRDHARSGWSVGPGPRAPAGFAYTFQMVTNASKAAPSATPCWENLVHLAEYVALTRMAETLDGVEVHIEDDSGTKTGRAMDLTVRFDGELAAFVEIKKDATAARTLVRQMCDISGSGQGDLRPIERLSSGSLQGIKDGAKKLNYMLTDLERTGRDQADIPFVVRASGTDEAPVLEHRFMARVDRVRRTVQLVGDCGGAPQDAREGGLRMPVALHLEAARDPSRRPAASLAWELERRSAQLWLARGVHDHSYIVYRSTPSGERILLGVQRDGRLYTESAALGDDFEAFRSVLRDAGFDLGRGMQWAYWRRGGAVLRLDEASAAQLHAEVLPEVARLVGAPR